MKKFLRFQNTRLLFLLALLLLSCKKEKGFLDKMEVGKYQITQYKEYPDGSKDTVVWIGYGPWEQVDRYAFDLDTFSEASYNMWYIQPNYVSLRSEQTAPCIYNGSLSSVTEDELAYEYTYYTNNLNEVCDSASGKLVFKRIDL